MYSCHLLISSASVRSLPFLCFIHLCMKCSLGISNFLEEIARVSHSVIVPLLVNNTFEGRDCILFICAYALIPLCTRPKPDTGYIMVN